MKEAVISAGVLGGFLLLFSSLVSAQVDRSFLDLRASISKEKEAKVSGSVETLYRVAKAGGSVEGKTKEEIQNLLQGASAPEQDPIKLRTLYIFCGMVANAKDISTERKVELFGVMMRVKDEPISPKPVPVKGIQPTEKPSWPNWTFDFFWCSASPAEARKMAERVRTHFQNMSGGGRWRSKPWDIEDSVGGYEIRVDRDGNENAVALRLRQAITQLFPSRPHFRVRQIGEDAPPTPGYVSIFFCPGLEDP